MAFDFDIVKNSNDNNVISKITFETLKNTLVYNNKQKSKVITYTDNCITIKYKLYKIFVHIQNTNNNVKVLIQEDNYKEKQYNMYAPHNAIPLSVRKMRHATSLERTIEHFDTIVTDIAEIFSALNIPKDIYVLQSFNNLDSKNYNNTLLSATTFYVISKLYKLYKIKPLFISEDEFSNNIKFEVNSKLETIIVKPYYFHRGNTIKNSDIKYINTIITENSELYKHFGYNVIAVLDNTTVKPENLSNIVSTLKGYFKNSMFENIPPIPCKFNDTKNSIHFDEVISHHISYYKNYEVCISRIVRVYMCKFMVGAIVLKRVEKFYCSNVLVYVAEHFNKNIEDIFYDIKARYNWLCMQYMKNS